MLFYKLFFSLKIVGGIIGVSESQNCTHTSLIVLLELTNFDARMHELSACNFELKYLSSWTKF